METTIVDQMRTLRKLLEERTAASGGKRPSNKNLAQYIKDHCEIRWLPAVRTLEYNLSVALSLKENTLDELDEWTQVLPLPYLPTYSPSTYLPLRVVSVWFVAVGDCLFAWCVCVLCVCVCVWCGEQAMWDALGRRKFVLGLRLGEGAC